MCERDLPKKNGSLLARKSMVADGRYAREGRFIKRGMAVQPLGDVLPLGDVFCWRNLGGISQSLSLSLLTPLLSFFFSN